jgi:hypothetical protein
MLRIHKQRARAALINALEATPGVADIPDEWEDMVFVDTVAGEHLVIYLFDRALDTADIAHTLTTNTAQGLHTLYILSAAMLLPEHGQHYTPEDWMALLAGLYGGKIYSYRVMRLVVDICPALFFPLGPQVAVQYGPRIDVAGLRCFPVQLDADTVLLADFELANFPPPHRDDTPPDLATLQPDFTATDPWRVLGLPPHTDRAIIKAAFRALARRFHPDTDRTPGAKARMQTLNRAYRELMTG